MLKVKDGMELVYPDGTTATFWSRIADRNSGNDVIWLPVLLVTFLIELNYHLVFKSKLKVFILTTLLCGISCMLMIRIPDLLAGRSFVPSDRFWPVTGGLIFFAGIFSLYAFFYAVTRDYIHTRIFIAEKRLRHSQAELAALKAQINPHFLFNTLNNIYGTALEENAGRTAQFIERLSGLMRYVIHNSQNDFIPVSHEIRFVKEYLELQRIRIPEQPNIVLVEQIEYDEKTANMAPLLLLPFIENAFQYGVSIEHECHISVKLKVNTQRLGMTITNRILPGLEKRKGEGTGILNARQQLALLYPNRHALKVSSDGEQFFVKLEIDLSK